MAVAFLLVLFANLSIHSEETNEPSQEWRSFLDLSVKLHGEAKTGEGIDLMVTYSNKLHLDITINAALNLCETRSGLKVTILDSQGKIIAQSRDESGEDLGIHLAPNRSQSEIVELPADLAPKVPGKYSLKLEYQRSYFVLGKGRISDIKISAEPLVFSVVYSEPIEVAAFSEKAYEAWKRRLMAERGKTRELLLHSVARDYDSRRYLIKVICDSSVHLDIKIAAASEVMGGSDFPYEQGIIDLIEARRTDTDLRIALVKFIFRMDKPPGITHDHIMRRLWGKAAKDPDLRYRYEVLRELYRNGAMPPAELLSEVDKQKDPNFQLFAVELLCQRSEYKEAKVLALKLVDNRDTPSQTSLVPALAPYIKIRPEETIGDIAKIFLKSIEHLEKEAGIGQDKNK
jgi:hypothetical protein